MSKKDKFGIFVQCSEDSCGDLSQIGVGKNPLEFNTRKDALHFLLHHDFAEEEDIHILKTVSE